ncbi:hypothetical protein IG631_24256 [Alternaria alternata]|nr:hypothetical protein IG631_24256 [Alternaria alternata]
MEGICGYFTETSVLEAFSATGIHPPSANVILDRFRTATPETAATPPERTALSSSPGEPLWLKAKSLLRSATKGGDATLNVRVTSHPTIPTLRVVPSSTRHNSTTMDPIQEAIEYLESREAGDELSYRQVAKIFGVDRTTLSRRHKGSQGTREAKIANQQRLHPQQEDEVIRHIDGATRDGLPPTRGILKNFGSAVAQQEVSDS